MTDRTTKVTLVASVSGYVAGMGQAAAATRATADAAQKLAAQKQAIRDVGVAFTAMGAVAAAGLVYAIKKFADFDAQMAQVKTLSHATGDEMKALTAAALNMGQKIGFSATEVADAETELIKAGIGVKDIMGGALSGALNLAAAGQIDVADATQIAAEAMTQFKLKGSDVPHIADLLAAGADKALGSVSDLGTALESGGLVAHQFGLTIEETVGTLAAFANAGLIGETAGTDLRQMLLKLGNPSADAAKTMKQLGINLYDAKGAFVGIVNLSGQLYDKMHALEPAQRNAALATIFGSRAIAGANVLYEQGAKGIQKMINAVNDQGFAVQQATGKMNNLNGDLKKLGAAFDTGIIQAGSSANGILRGLTQGLTSVVSAIGNTSPVVLGLGLGVTALVAGVGLLGGGFLLLVPRIRATQLAMKELNLTGGSVARGFGKGGAVLLAVTAITSAFTNMSSTAQLSADKIADVNSVLNNLSPGALNNLFGQAGSNPFGGAQVDFTKQADKFKESLNSLASGDFWQNSAAPQKFIDGLTFGLTHFSDAAKDNEARLKAMGQTLGETAKTDFPKAATAFAQIAKAAGGGKEAVRQLLTEMPDYKASLVDLAAQSGITLTQTQLFALAQDKGTLAQKLAKDSTIANQKALASLSGQAVDTTGSVKDLADAISNFGKGALDTEAASRDFHQALDDLTASVKKNGQTLDLNTQAGRDNDQALDRIATTALALASQQASTGASTATLTQTMQDGRTAFINAAIAAGKTRDAAAKLADQYGLIPKNVNTAVTVTGVAPDSPNISNLQKWKNLLAGVPSVVRTQVQFDQAFKLPTQNTPGKANGGILPGPPSSKDNMFIHAASGEFVVNARATAANRGLLESINSGVNGYSTGGLIRSSRPSHAGSQSAAAIAPVVYVQNPFTGEYLLAQVDGRAHAQVMSAQHAQDQAASRGYRRQP